MHVHVVRVEGASGPVKNFLVTLLVAGSRIAHAETDTGRVEMHVPSWARDVVFNVSFRGIAGLMLVTLDASVLATQLAETVLRVGFDAPQAGPSQVKCHGGEPREGGCVTCPTPEGDVIVCV